MNTRLIVTDLTRMQHGRVCIAGYRPDGICIRPVMLPPGVMETWMYVEGQVVIRPFAEIELELEPTSPEPPHTEDWRIRSGHPTQRRMLNSQEREQFIGSILHPDVASIFGIPLHHEGNRYYIPVGEGTRSLGTVGPVQIQKVELYEDESIGTRQPYIVFNEKTPRAAEYRLTVTDLVFRYFAHYLRTTCSMNKQAAQNHMTMLLARPPTQIYLRIGLARGTWEKHPNCCHVQITGVYSFPDYLDGKCFADFEAAL